MSMCHCIRKTLNIIDENITFDQNYLTEEKYRNVLALVFNGTLAPKTPNSCPKCGIININYTIIKHGSKTTNTLMPRVSNRLVILRLKKQRFLCKSCNKTFTPLTDVVKFNHTISKNSIRSAVLGLKEKSSIVDIARRHDSCFPKAKIITDRFHVVQLINRSLNSSRIQTMKDYKPMYARLKRYWKLILKPNENLDSLNYKSFVCFKYKMTELEVVNELLRIDKEFENTYWYYQEFLRNFKRKNINRCISLIHNPRDSISPSMEKTVKTLNKYEESISNALIYPYSNGVVEGTNNLIKVIKRITFGYRNYDNFRARILLITNTLVLLKTTLKMPSFLK